MSAPAFRPSCLTVDMPVRANVLVSSAGIAHHLPKGQVPPGVVFHPGQAIWDTGATGTVITRRMVQAAGLQPISMTMTHGVHGEQMANVFLVALRLPSEVVFQRLRVTEGVLGPGVDILIGMDVIGMGDFALTNVGGKTTFSFRLPSMERIDFGARPQPKPAPHVNDQPKPGRNDPCPCGSGKKYKHCHGS